MSDKKEIVVALAGNPNAGKTSLFNKLTGLRSHVGNYPGVTVEQKWGYIDHQGYLIKIVDLPGTYSLNSYSLDEKVARDFIINERPDMVVNVVDSTNLERNLYLTLQFLELGISTIVALNMMDMATARGINIDTDQLEKHLKADAVPIVATQGKGVTELLDTIVAVAGRPKKPWRPLAISYGQEIDEVIEQLAKMVEKSSLPAGQMSPRWLAIKYLESDLSTGQFLAKEDPNLLAEMEPVKSKLAAHIRTTLDDEIDGAITDKRYGFIAGFCRGVTTHTRKDTREISDIIDKVLLNRLVSPLFFLAVIYGLYVFTFWASGPVVGWFEAFFDFLSGAVEDSMGEGLLKSLLLEGIIGGVGGVLGFTPLIAFMFMGISILEDSGYMARVAFILDRIFRAFGLHGNSVVALIVGGGIAGGCAIPAVMATRTLRDPKERIATILVTPFMNCGAKLPVFLMLVAAFFSENQALVMMSLTLFAWVIALVSAKLLRVFLLPGKSAPFVLELPPYRMPTLTGVLLHAWERTWAYVKKAGTIIVAVTIVIWFMMTFPGLPEDIQAPFDSRIERLESQIETGEPSKEVIADLEDQKEAIARELDAETLRFSLAGRVGSALEPLSQTIGFDWRTNIALVGGFAAKEVVLSTLGTVYAMDTNISSPGDDEELDEQDALINSLSEKLANDPDWSPLAAVSLMVFVLIYAPCFATIAVIRKEIGGRWALFSLIASTVYAYLLCLIIFQGGKILGLG